MCMLRCRQASLPRSQRVFEELQRALPANRASPSRNLLLRECCFVESSVHLFACLIRTPSGVGTAGDETHVLPSRTSHPWSGHWIRSASLVEPHHPRRCEPLSVIRTLSVGRLCADKGRRVLGIVLDSKVDLLPNAVFWEHQRETEGDFTAPLLARPNESGWQRGIYQTYALARTRECSELLVGQ